MVTGSSQGLVPVDFQAEGPVPLDSTEHHQLLGECWFLNHEVVRPPSSRIRGLQWGVSSHILTVDVAREQKVCLV